MKKFTCVLKVLPLPAYGVQWNVQVKEPAQIYNTFWKFPLKLFQTCEEKVKFRHLMNTKVNARHQKFPHPYAQSGMREGLIRAGGGGEEVLSGWCSSMELPQSHPKYQQEGNEEYKAYTFVNALYAP